MRSTVALVTLALSFLTPFAISVAEAADATVIQPASLRADCRNRRAKKQQTEGKKKDKDGKKPYGFEL